MKRYEKPKKAHMYLRAGYWRVNHMPSKSWQNGTGAEMFASSWQPAHAFVNKLNNERHEVSNERCSQG